MKEVYIVEIVESNHNSFAANIVVTLFKLQLCTGLG